MSEDLPVPGLQNMHLTLNPNPSTSLIKVTIFKDTVLGEISRQRLATIRWLFVGGKGITFNIIFWGPILK